MRDLVFLTILVVAVAVVVLAVTGFEVSQFFAHIFDHVQFTTQQ